MRIVRHHLDHRQHRRMVRVIESIQFRILTVNGQGILSQIIGTNAEEIHLLGQLPADHHRRRGLNHDALLRITVLYLLLRQLHLHLCHNFGNGIQFLDTGDHGIHDQKIAKGTGPEQSPQLRLEDFRPGQTDPDGTTAHGRIFLLLQMEVITLLVRTDVQCTDDHRLSGHGFHHMPVYLELLLLCGEVFLLEIQEFAAEQADACRVVLHHGGQILAVANVRIQLDLLAVQRYGFLSAQGLQQCLLLLLLLLLLTIGLQCLRIRLHVNNALGAVHDGQLSVHTFIQRHIGADQCRNAHGPGQNRRMGIHRALYRHKGKHLVLLQLHRFRGCQILRHDDHRLVCVDALTIAAGQYPDDPLRNILHVRCTAPHILIVHGRKHLGKVVAGHRHGIFRIDLLGFNDVPGSIQIIVILQHHLVDLEDGRIGLADFLHCLVIELSQLPDCLLHGIIEALLLRLRILDFRSLYGLLALPVNADLTDGHTAKYTFSLICLHADTPLYSFSHY